MRLGILTGGGDCPGLNAIIRAAAVHANRTHQGHILGFEDGWRGLFESRIRDHDLPTIEGIPPRGASRMGWRPWTWPCRGNSAAW